MLNFLNKTLKVAYTYIRSGLISLITRKMKITKICDFTYIKKDFTYMKKRIKKVTVQCWLRHKEEEPFLAQ